MRRRAAAVCLFSCLFWLACSGVHGQTAATAAAPGGAAQSDAALATLLRQADQLIRGGRPAEAYSLLEPKEMDYSGETAFDYMLGIAALDIGKPDRATIAFERVLVANPNFTGARIDLGRAYFAMGSDDLARHELQIVLAQNPPQAARAVVDKYLAAIAERRLARLQQVSAYLETSLSTDSNITAVTADFANGVQSTYGIPGVTPTGSSVLRTGVAEGLAAGISIVRLLDEEYGISAFAGADLRQKIYNIAAMNSSNVDLRGGASIASGDDVYRLVAGYGQFRQTGLTPGINGDRHAPAWGLEWARKLGENDLLTVTGQLSKPRYATQETQDTDQTSLGASLLHVFSGSKAPLIFLSLNRSVDRALRPLASGSDVSRTTTAIRAHFQVTPVASADLFVAGGLSLRQDDTANGRSALDPPVYGRDLGKDLALGCNWRPWPRWTARGQVATFRNDSNLALYQYRRTETTVSLRYEF